jgi:osmotically-inducible protein OsmY
MLQRWGAVLAAAILTVACAQTDAGISTNVKTKLAADNTVKAYQIDVDTRNGVVTLSGDVESAAAKEQAILIARQTDGVRDVVDQIHVSETAATAGIDRERDADKPGLDTSIGDKAAAETREATAEAKEVASEAKAKTSAAADKAGAVITDAAITSAVKAKFLADTSVKGLQIDVDTQNGMVTLNGNVASRAEADRAMALARNTDGVKGVHDNLKISR